jgi:hypothetical protein
MAPWLPPPRTVFVPGPRVPAPPPRLIGVTPLRPLTGREIAAGGWRVWLRHPIPLSVAGLAVGSVVHGLALLVWSVFWSFLSTGPGVVVGLAATVLLASVGQVLLVGVVSVVVDHGVAGRPVTASGMWKVIGPVWWRLVGLSVCCGVAVSVGLVLGVVPGLLLWVVFSLSAPALVRERLTIRQALTRSRVLVRGAWDRAFFVLALTIACAGAVSVKTFLDVFPRWDDDASLWVGDTPIQWLLFTAVELTIWSALTAPIAAAAVSMLYVDRRFAEQVRTSRS